MKHSTSRRRFLRFLGAGGVGAAVAKALPFFGGARGAFGRENRENGRMPRRTLGRTGADISLFSLGGEATVERADRRDESVEIIERALDLGVNYIDTSPRYGNGGSERNIGEVMAHRRDEVFLATKTHERTHDGTMRLVEESLERLRTDHLDLYQLHNIRLHSDLDQVFADNGAIHALRRLKDEGVVSNIGITGHRDPEVLLRGIREHRFDTILMSLNAGDSYYKPFQDELLEEAVSQDLGIIAMKVTAVGRIFRDGGLTSMEDALSYVLSFPVSTAIVGVSTLAELEQNVEIASAFDRLSGSRMEEIEGLVAEYEREANFFKHHW